MTRNSNTINKNNQPETFLFFFIAYSLGYRSRDLIHPHIDKCLIEKQQANKKILCLSLCLVLHFHNHTKARNIKEEMICTLKW